MNLTDSLAANLHLTPTNGLCFWGPGGDHYRFLVTGSQNGNTSFVLEAVVPPGGGPPPHTHTREDEYFYLIDGALTVFVGDRVIEAAKGDFIHAPRGVSHHYRNSGDTPARMLALFTPAGMEHWFRECLVPVTADQSVPPEASPEFIQRMIEAGPRHGVRWE